jgi:hypothetical protein
MLEVNRSAIVVIPKQPLLDWLNLVDPGDGDLTLAGMQAEPHVYLIPEVESEEDLGRYLKKVAQGIFEQQLNDWITDDTLWPPDRSFEIFTHWFAVSYHSFVYDFSKQPLKSARRQRYSF